MEAPSLKKGNGREIRCLHDVLLQHYRAIKAMDPVNFGETLLTAFIELKLDPTAMRDWQHSTREDREVPPFEDLVNFLQLQARDAKNGMCDVVKKHPTASNPGNKTTRSYTVGKEDSCVACKNDNHALYGCKAFIDCLPTREWSLSGTVVFASIA